MVDKHYLDAQSLLEDSWRLGAMIQASGFKPDFICAIWRGGVPIGIALQSFLARFGTQSDHIAVDLSAPIEVTSWPDCTGPNQLRLPSAR